MVNLPNKISLMRIALIPLFIIILMVKMPYGNIIAVVVFVILALSDTLDGYIARKRNQVTELGGLIDPLADCGENNGPLNIFISHSISIAVPSP